MSKVAFLQDRDNLLALLRSGANPVTYIAGDGEVLMINDAGRHYLGLGWDDVIGRSIYELFPDMADELRERLALVESAPGPLRFEDEVALPGGARVFESINTPLIDAAGRRIGMQVMSHDVTARREAERDREQARERLAASEKRFQLAMEAVRDGVWDWNVVNGDYWLSPNFYQLVGYTEEQINEGRAEWFFSILHPEDAPRVQKLLEAHFLGQTSEYVAEFRWQHKDGSWRWALSRGQTVERNTDGSPLRMMGTTLDVTDRHELEARLLAAEKMEAIGRLAGGVAHDFNNLLTAVMGHLHFLEGYNLNDDAQHELGQIAAAVQQASRLTTQLLSFARRRMVRPKEIELNPLISEMRSLLAGLLGADIALDFDLSPDLPNVFIDPAQCEQILVNLALNARDAMVEGGRLSFDTVRVELDESHARTDPEVTPGTYVRLRVSDTGTGMDDETIEHAFEPFFTTKPVGQGTGLGLASCYGIVKQAGGHIGISSERDVGTAFTIHLPAVESSATDEPEVAADRSSRKRVLVVEDDPLVRRMAVRALEREDYEVFEAGSGDQALALPVLADGIELLVTDVVMPGMTGKTLSERLTAIQPDVRVLFMSGYAGDAVTRHGVLSDEANFLAKPFTPTELLAKVKELLEP